MKNAIMVISFMVMIALLSISTGCSKGSSPTEPAEQDTTDPGPVVRKPNIYIYPQIKSIVTVNLDFPQGGTVIESIPTYTGGWRVEVTPSGRIDNQYDYLFYECRVPDAYQYEAGWIVCIDSLELFFRSNLEQAGFINTEIEDFVSYWIPRLTDHSDYIIYPQFSKDIEKVIKLNIHKIPDNILRLFYVIKGHQDSVINLTEPVIPEFDRSGFVVTE